jgi:hypothetical protein
MARITTNVARTYVTKDGKYKLSVVEDWYAENPLDEWDLPLVVEDYHRQFSITRNHGKNNRNIHGSIEEACHCLIGMYGKKQDILKFLEDNHSANVGEEENCLHYDKEEGRWELMESYKNVKTRDIEWGNVMWLENGEDNFYIITEQLSKSTLLEIVEKYLDDKVKVMFYRFNGEGEVHFSKLSQGAHGIAYLEKKEAVGNGKWFEESRWNSEDCKSLCCGLIEEIEAWSENECYYGIIEEKEEWDVHRVCTSNSNKRATDEHEVIWEEIDQSGTYYGNINIAVEYIIDGQSFFNEEDLIEVS